MKRVVLSFLLLLIVFNFVPEEKISAQLIQTVQEKIQVPNFSLFSADGQRVSLEDYEGRVVILNFWATWCGYCRAEMDDLQQLHLELSEGDQAVLLLLNQIDQRLETEKSGREYLEKNGYTMTNLYDYGEVGQAIFGVYGLPTTIAVDRAGYLSSFIVGPANLAALRQMIEGAL